ncbi:RHS repeat domain-containing protein [Tenacibaculum sp. 47A_GOM-205m]|uniref:RHS repeat domain-containing protein n=1 Tax=Tenacibaculum sp. 47A_GOM-205m TaxID=1380384 RepID=UPI000490D75F|nr:RHS repeat-associated core domain-containing protein [Tenacibaculum sp. 47A_GOM-205m]
MLYKDQDGDGLGDPNEPHYANNSSFTIVCEARGYVDNADDKCPLNVGFSADSGCPVGGFATEARNSVYEKSYLINKKVVGESKAYYDDLGKLEQTLSLDIKTRKVWGSQVLYDAQGRPSVQTMSSPAYPSRTLIFKSDFIKKPDGSTYIGSDFNGVSPENSPTIGSQTNSLGWYYSNSNTSEVFQDQTNRPYSRILYSTLNPGAVKQVVGGNKHDTNGDGNITEADGWKQGYSFSMPAAQEMYYVYGYNIFSAAPEIIKEYTDSRELPDQSTYPRTYYGVRVLSYSTTCLPAEGLSYLDKTDKFNIRAQKYLEVGKIYIVKEENASTLFKVQVTNRAAYGDANSDQDENTILIAGEWENCNDWYSSENNKVKSIASNSNNYITWLKAGKSVVQDVKGNEAVVFTNADGKTLGAARSGGSKQYEVLSLIGEQKYVDIHIPIGCQSVGFIGSISDFKVYDLKNEKLLSTTPSVLPAGFYRVEYVGTKTLSKSHQLTYINKSAKTIQPVMSDAVGIRYKINYYDYSLNYYNEVGQLTSSLQPLGFVDSCLNELKPTVTHDDSLKSEFKYNTLGQLIWTKSPDEGEASFKYRKDGQIRFSQNSKQVTSGEFSYTNYDELGRPIESGVALGVFTSLDADVLNFTSSVKKEQHFTEYDYLSTTSQSRLNSLASTVYRKPTFLSGNVAYTYNKDETGTKISESFYSYDMHGRVKWIVQKSNGLSTAKTIDYEYDPVTGQVVKVDFQKNTLSERFVHKYTYDADTQALIKVETSTNGSTFITHAIYEYYENGALKRTELAGGIQGLDYVYNLAGQLKGINHPELTSTKDPGGDHTDLFGLQLNYHVGDYTRDSRFQTQRIAGIEDQFNGNIQSMRWNSKVNTTDANSHPLQYSYTYNKNNWLKSAKFNSNEFAHTGEYKSGDYDVSNITYDANGNILSLHRNKKTIGSSSNRMDELEYKYKNVKSNRLDRVIDAVGNAGVQDIDTQAAGNYVYNSIGQLIEDHEYVTTTEPNNIVRYIYNTSGLVTEVTKNDVPLVKFVYDDKGFRAQKISYKSTGVVDKTTNYVRDATGSVLAIYEGDVQKELPIYGGSRLGVYNKATGASVYQLTDHLGNVRAVIAKQGSNAVAISKTDYYPFGMPMPNRNIVGDYRYAFQGQEKDIETGKEAFQLRLWDARIGRWLTTDPAGQYASPYLGMGNNPMNGIDPDGAEWHWEGDDLVADPGDNAYTLADFLGIDLGTSMGILNNNGITSTNGILNLKVNDILKVDVDNLYFENLGEVKISNNPIKNLFYANTWTRGHTPRVGEEYHYTEQDLKVAISILNGPSNPIKTELIRRLKVSAYGDEYGNFPMEPISKTSYYLRYGHTLGTLKVGDQYIRLAKPLLFNAAVLSFSSGAVSFRGHSIAPINAYKNHPTIGPHARFYNSQSQYSTQREGYWPE